MEDPYHGGASAWFPASPYEQDTVPSAPAPASALVSATGAGQRRNGPAGRHRMLITVPQRFRTIIATAGIAAAGIAALALGIFLVWSHPATVQTRNCRPGSCGGTVSQALGTAPVTVSSGASAPAGGSLPETRGATARATASTGAQSATAGTAAAANSDPTATAGAAAIAPETATASAGPSPSPATSAPRLTPGSVISINATTACCTMFYIRHDDGDDRVVITEITAGSSALDKADATWTVQAGLADSSCISFESANDPGQYLRHYDFELYLEPNDGTSQFAQDSTFCPRPGNSGHGYSFESVNYPNKYIRHYDYVVYIASDGGSNPWDNNLSVWPEDTSWLVTQPWG
jgi:non-reducing end alpha-L-arabinofuranosidase